MCSIHGFVSTNGRCVIRRRMVSFSFVGDVMGQARCDLVIFNELFFVKRGLFIVVSKAVRWEDISVLPRFFVSEVHAPNVRASVAWCRRV